MEPSNYIKLYEFLRSYPLEVSLEEGFTFFQTNDELIAIKQTEETGKLRIYYQTLDYKLAKITLESCPEVIKSWGTQFGTLKKVTAHNFVLQSGGKYAPVPSFESNLSLEKAIEVCSYLAARMIENARKYMVLN